MKGKAVPKLGAVEKQQSRIASGITRRHLLRLAGGAGIALTLTG